VLPRPRLVGGDFIECGERGGEPAPRRQHRPLDLLARRGGELLALARRHVGDRGEARLESGDEHVLRGIGRQERLHVGAHPPQHEARRREIPLRPLAHRRDHLIDRHAEARQPLHVVPGVPRVVHLVHVEHEVGQLAVDAVELVQRVVVEEVRLAVGANGQEPVEHVARQALRWAELRPRIAAQDLQVAAHPSRLLELELQREVVEVVVVEVEPPRLEQA